MNYASYELPNYTNKHQVWGDRIGSSPSIYIFNSLNLKIRPDLSITKKDTESLWRNSF